MKIHNQFVRVHGDFDLDEWQFGYGELDKTIAKGVSEAIRNSYEEHYPIPMLSSRKIDGDLFTISVSLPYNDDCEIVFSLRNMIRSDLNDLRHLNTPIAGTKEEPQARAISHALRQLAIDVDHWIDSSVD